MNSQEIRDEFYTLAVDAWATAEQQKFEDAFALYEQAELFLKSNIADSVEFSPTLNMLRHVSGDGDYFANLNGLVQTAEPTENDVFGVQANVEYNESPSPRGMKKTKINQKQIEKNILKYHFNAGHHLKNIMGLLWKLPNKNLQPHLLVMSTGRCGTMSLYRLFQQSQYFAHHQFFYNVSEVHRLEQMCRHIEGDYTDDYAAGFWLSTRAAEWLSAILNDRPMAIFGHHDTIFAPTFSALHMQSKIIYLRRNPQNVFASMYGKNQWGDRQLRPVYYRFGDKWEWKDQNLDIPEQIVWYLKFTEAFSRAVGNAIPDRWIEIDADKLFAQDSEEIEKLHTFTDLDIPMDETVNHFATVYNRKAHKDKSYSKGMKLFEEIYEKM